MLPCTPSSRNRPTRKKHDPCDNTDRPVGRPFVLGKHRGFLPPKMTPFLIEGLQPILLLPQGRRSYPKRDQWPPARHKEALRSRVCTRPVRQSRIRPR